jgi:hypothetical protein
MDWLNTVLAPQFQFMDAMQRKKDISTENSMDFIYLNNDKHCNVFK